MNSLSHPLQYTALTGVNLRHDTKRIADHQVQANQRPATDDTACHALYGNREIAWNGRCKTAAEERW
jgi:hypothetical protein